MAAATVTIDAGEGLTLRYLRVCYATAAGPVKAPNGISFGPRVGERFGLVGESGSVKSTTALAIMRIIRTPGRIVDGEMALDGQNPPTLTGARSGKPNLPRR